MVIVLIQFILMVRDNCNIATLCISVMTGMAIDEEDNYIDTPLFAIYTVLSIIGILFACAMLIFNLWYREQP